jgi:type II secretory pathway component GspD/PulD (secretin)
MKRTMLAYRIALLLTVAAFSGGSVAIAAEEEKPASANSDANNQLAMGNPAANVPDASDGQVYIIKYADPYSIVEQIKSILTNNQAMVTIIPENPSASSTTSNHNASEKTSSIIVYGSPEIYQKVAEAIKKLDVPATAKPKAGVKETSGEMETYSIKNPNPKTVISAMENISPKIVVTSVAKYSQDTTNYLITVQAPAELRPKVAEILKQLDASQTISPDNIKIFHLSHAEPAMVAKLLTEMLGPNELRVATDERTQSIIASGSPKTLDAVTALLQKLDSPMAEDGRNNNRNWPVGAAQRSAGYEVRVIWLASGLTGEHKGESPSGDLKEVVAELARMGITDPRQVGQMVVQTTSGANYRGRFDVKSLPRFGDGSVKFDASGTIVEERPDGTLVMQINITTKPATGAIDQNFNQVQTQITLPRKQYIVLATAPVGDQTSVFVIQVAGVAPVQSLRSAKGADAGNYSDDPFSVNPKGPAARGTTGSTKKADR